MESDLARLAAIVASSDDAIISKDLDGLITSWNKGAERLFGYAPEEIIGKPVTLLIPTDHLDEELQILDQLRRGQKIEQYETTRIAKDGRLLDVLLTVSPIRDDVGRVVGASKIVRDIAEHRRMKGEVEQSRVRLQAILDTAIDAIISIDGRGLIQTVNRATERMFGYTATELLGQNIKILMPPPYREEHDGYLARYRQTGEKRIIGIGREVMARRKDGIVFAIDLAVSEVEPGKLFTGIIRDISERKSSEAKLRQSDRMASLGTLAAGLGHDMNNVLLPVRARLNALKAAGEAGRIPAAERKHVDDVRKSVAYLQQLADGLHFLAMDPDTEEDARGGGAVTDLRHWWAQAGALLSKAVPKHVRVTASFPAELPPAAVAAHGLTQAVLNLVVNAGEAIPGPNERKRRQGLVRVWADVTKDADGAWVRLNVTDNGSGMPEDVKRRAFEMFFTTKPRGLGTGLGLALVLKVVERAGGRVEIDSQVGKGTTVTMILPVARSANQAKTEPDAPSAVVALSDGRAAALIRHVLEVSGTPIRADGDATGAEIWVISPADTSLDAATAWRNSHPQGRLVLFGKPSSRSSAAWKALQPVTIDNPDDFEAVRTALARAMARS